ncbi:hypothetical protein P5V15_006741 [Pogonomyrmex californicus]
MSQNAGKDFSASPEIEQLLPADIHHDTPNTCVRFQSNGLLSVNESHLQSSVSSLRPSPQDKSVELNSNAHIDETSSGPTSVIISSSIIANGNETNDDPPPYTVIPPPYSTFASPDHDWPYGLFSFGNPYSTDDTTCRMEIPLTPFQAYLTPATGFHPEGINSQYLSYQMPLMPHRFFKFGSHMNSLTRETVDNEIAEKVDDRKSRRYGAILVAAAVIIFLMALSLMVRFVMERSWWRR